MTNHVRIIGSIVVDQAKRACISLRPVFLTAIVIALSAGASAYANSLVINPVFDATITSDPNAATIEGTINSAISVYESTFSDPITVTIDFQEVTSGLGGSSTFFATGPYTVYLAALAADATSSDDATALAHLPAGPNNPVNGSAIVNVTLANLRAVGINLSPPPGQPDSTISLNTSIMNLSRPDTDPTKYDLFAVVSHEIDEALGFGSSLNGLANGTPSPTGGVFPEDLFRYDQNGARSFTTSINAQAFFSIDGGTTDLARFNQDQNGDFSDWYSPGGQTPQIQDAFGTTGAMPNLGVELRALDVIGYDAVNAAPVPEPGTLFLVGTGLATMLGAARRKWFS